jgi:penicillin-binding protein 1C
MDLSYKDRLFNKVKRNMRKRKFFLYGGIAALCAIIAGVIWFITIINDLPRPEKISTIQPVQSTKIYDRTGEILLYEIHQEQNRTIVAGSDIPAHAKQATLAVEDQGFYRHAAFDVGGFLRAVYENALVVTGIKKGNLQGGSTITQQLVKNVFLTPEKTITRKAKELVLAYWLEQEYSKDEILDFYLNQVPYGSNAYGIESASNMFFGISAKNLTVAQSAALAAVLQSPSYYSPWGRHVDEFLNRQKYVLREMHKLGFISREQLQQALNENLEFQPQSYGKIKAPHFVFDVREYLVEKYGEDMVENGGLKVVTTLDWKKQEIAEAAVRKGAESNSKNYKGSNAALVAEDPKTGQILAMVGSADYFNKEIDGNFNVISQGMRQPGSTMKPLVYLASFMKGYTPDTIVFDVPTEFTPNNPLCPPIVDFNNRNSACFHPQNYDPVFAGPVPLKVALSQSINIPAVKVLYLTGLSYAIETAEKLGIRLGEASQYGLSLVLGGGEVKPLELAHAYAALAQDGVQHQQTYILRIEDAKGRVLEEFKDSAEQVLEPQYVRQINAILSDNELRSGLFHSSLPLTIFDGYQVALKTGTTNDYRDAWTVGYSPFLTTLVWAGNNNNNAMVRQGGSILAALPMWSEFMREALKDYPPESFPAPYPVTTGNPVLDGQHITIPPNSTSPQVHNILYYISKNDPLDFSPPRANDPQFTNWEIPVLNWARQNIPNFDAQYNK